MKQSNVKEYFKPSSLDEAISMLNSYNGEIKVVAGATDMFADDHPTVEALVDLSKLNLNYIKEEDGFLKIGSLTTINELVKSEIIISKFKGLWEACKVLADKTTRNSATIGGNICSSLPSADSVPPIFAAGAVLVVKTSDEEKFVNIEEFFTGPRKNILKKDEILTEIQIPICNCSYGTGFEKMTRNSEDLALVNAAAYVEVDSNNKIKKAKVVLGAVAPTAVRAKQFEEVLIGLKLYENENLDKLSELVADSIAPISDIRCNKEYRVHASKVLAKRAIFKAYQRAVENN